MNVWRQFLITIEPWRLSDTAVGKKIIFLEKKIKILNEHECTSCAPVNLCLWNLWRRNIFAKWQILSKCSDNQIKNSRSLMIIIVQCTYSQACVQIPKSLTLKPSKSNKTQLNPSKKLISSYLDLDPSAIEETLSWLCFTEWILLSQSISLSDLFMTERR